MFRPCSGMVQPLNFSIWYMYLGLRFRVFGLRVVEPAMTKGR